MSNNEEIHRITLKKKSHNCICGVPHPITEDIAKERDLRIKAEKELRIYKAMFEGAKNAAEALREKLDKLIRWEEK